MSDFEAITRVAKLTADVSVEKGWWDCELCKGEGSFACKIKGAGPQDHAVVVCPQCDGTGIHSNIGEKLALIMAEAAEALEHARNSDKDADCDKCDGLRVPEGWSDAVKEMLPPTCKKCGGTGDALGGSRVGEELADVIIRVFDLCVMKDIDIGETIRQKHEYNKTRPFKHGKEF